MSPEQLRGGWTPKWLFKFGVALYEAIGASSQAAPRPNRNRQAIWALSAADWMPARALTEAPSGAVRTAGLCAINFCGRPVLGGSKDRRTLCADPDHCPRNLAGSMTKGSRADIRACARAVNTLSEVVNGTGGEQVTLA